MTIENKMTGDFRSKPKTMEMAEKIITFTKGLGPSRQETTGQMTFAGKRKFLWMWTYGGTGDGTLYLTVCLDREVNDSHFHYVKQTSPTRWNHHVVVKSPDQIESPWFKDLVKAGYDFANK
ncbi:DUF5655 domain-containing protein [Rhizobium sp. PEPV16]|uniref:DUF5655 domain-containing protein n=1 Tax=Rhizobium sp. PEPV16 TaxID=1820614 RepID=UPI00124CA065|nr:DUF5655 domain-containing protein [Rhizobium sp. PEPV16]KAF5882148.1 hypothetical protein FY112_26915 [Rhizobium sp. PEPV16]